MKILTTALLSLAVGSTASATDLQLTVSPEVAKPGQIVTVTMTNTSATDTYTLPSPCLWKSVNAGGYNAVPVFNMFCGSFLSPVAPGQTISMAWDQTDDSGSQVGDGTYVFPVRIYDASFSTITMAPTVVVSSVTNPPALYGKGGAGSAGWAPILGSHGVPSVGNSAFHLSVYDALGAAPAMMLISAKAGETTVGWGTYLLDLSAPVISIALPLGGAGAGAGSLNIPAPLPNNPALIGQRAFTQVIVLDAGSAGNLAHTNGLEVILNS